LDRGVNRNLVYDNEIIGNKSDGFAIYQSSYNQIYNNVIQDNGRYGIRVSAEFDDADIFDDVASDNVIRNNIVTRSGKHGIYLNERADRNMIIENQVISSTENGIQLNVGLTLVQGNIVSGSGKDGLLIDSKPYTGGTNPGGPSKPPLGQSAYANQILANRFQRNGESGIQINGGGNNRLGSLGAGNIISENLDSGILLKRTEATILDSNELRNNRAGNGAGVNSTCVVATPVTHTFMNNVILGNVSTEAKGYGAGIYLGEGCYAEINGNWLYNNRVAATESNLQNGNLTGSPDIQASGNVWGAADPTIAENGIWHQIDNPSLGLISFLPLGTGPMEPPATPIPTPTATPTATPLVTLAAPTSTPQATATPTVMPTGTRTPLPPDTVDETLYLPLITR
jgi:parallel beta-helix repeat protein